MNSSNNCGCSPFSTNMVFSLVVNENHGQKLFSADQNPIKDMINPLNNPCNDPSNNPCPSNPTSSNHSWVRSDCAKDASSHGDRGEPHCCDAKGRGAWGPVVAEVDEQELMVSQNRSSSMRNHQFHPIPIFSC